MNLSHLIDLSTHYDVENKGNTCKLPCLSVYRRHAESDIEATIYEPVICLILQGSKVASFGDQRVDLRPGDALLVSHDLPVVSRITKASARTPYIAVILSLDLGLVRSLCGLVVDATASDARAGPLSAGLADPAWLAPLTRYFEMMDTPLDAKVLGPATLREIHYRLLISPIGGMLRRLLYEDSHASRVAKAIQTVRAELRSPLSVPELARTVGMSTSSFHQHFKSITGTTPLQYQKDLRLIKARVLMVEQGRTVTEVAYTVGYESPTHFSRDYSRKFGLPPSRDARRTVSASQEAMSATA